MSRYGYYPRSEPLKPEIEMIQYGAIMGTVLGALAGSLGTASVVIPSFEVGLAKFIVGLIFGGFVGAILGAVSLSISQVLGSLAKRLFPKIDLDDDEGALAYVGCTSLFYAGALVSGSLLAMFTNQLSVFFHFIPPSFHEQVPTLSFVNIAITVAIAWHLILGVMFIGSALCLGGFAAYTKLTEADGRLSFFITAVAVFGGIGAFFAMR